jgi:hypothetical protein
LIKKLDQEVHMKAGTMPKGGKDGAHARFVYQLSFETLYRNSIELEKLEKDFSNEEQGKNKLKVKDIDN